MSTSERQNQTELHIKKKRHIVVPYSQGLCESYTSICNKHGIQVSFKGGQTLKKCPLMT